jgi:hypothetical protein
VIHTIRSHCFRLLFALVVVGASLMFPSSQASANTQFVCYGVNIPAGYVIIGRTYLAGCGQPPVGSNANAYQITTPYNYLDICHYSPKPAGYVFVGLRSSVSCDSNANNVYTIHQPYNGIVVCYFSPIPSGYRVISSRNQVGCGTYYPYNAYVISR